MREQYDEEAPSEWREKKKFNKGPTKCQDCGAFMWFGKTKSGKWVPLDLVVETFTVEQGGPEWGYCNSHGGYRSGDWGGTFGDEAVTYAHRSHRDTCPNRALDREPGDQPPQAEGPTAVPGSW